MTTVRDAWSIAGELMWRDTTVSVVVGDLVPTTGYCVGVKGFGCSVDNDYYDPIALIRWVEGIRTRAAQPGYFLGSWTDKETRRTYFDLVRIYPERGQAEAEAKRTGEIAFWDIGKGEEVRV